MGQLAGNGRLAEELFQDLWMNLIAARERRQVHPKFAICLYTIARSFGHYRQQGLLESVAFTDVGKQSEGLLRAYDSVQAGTQRAGAPAGAALAQVGREVLHRAA